jgi:hypothetical protein
MSVTSGWKAWREMRRRFNYAASRHVRGRMTCTERGNFALHCVAGSGRGATVMCEESPLGVARHNIGNTVPSWLLFPERFFDPILDLFDAA